MDFAVLDSSGSWLSVWKECFKSLEIEFLRSPITHHPDPYDAWTLDAFVRNRCSNKKANGHFHHFDGIQRSSSFHGPFYSPFAADFEQFCKRIVIHRHQLENKVKCCRVENIAVLGPQDFKLETTCGSVFHAHHIVLATGPLNQLAIPTWALPFLDNENNASRQSPWINHLGTGKPLDTLIPKLNNQQHCHVVVVGGGLSSVQATLRLLKQTPSSVVVHLICRRRIRFQAFDVKESWMGRFRPMLLCDEFWNCKDMRDRVDVLKKAKGEGSSVPLDYWRQMTPFIETSRLVLREEDQVQFIDIGPDDNWTVQLESSERVTASAILLCTGCSFLSRQDRLLQQLHDQLPIDEVGGLPVLENDLSWKRGYGVYVMGGYASLQLGPGAMNLAGSRGAAFRIRSSILSHFKNND